MQLGELSPAPLHGRSDTPTPATRGFFTWFDDVIVSFFDIFLL